MVGQRTALMNFAVLNCVRVVSVQSHAGTKLNMLCLYLNANIQNYEMEFCSKIGMDVAPHEVAII